MISSRYIFWGSLFGKYWKYIFVGLSLNFLVYYLVWILTGDQVLGFIIAVVLTFILIGYLMYLGEKSLREQRNEMQQQKKKMKKMAHDLITDADKCISCLTPLEEGNLICPNCGYENKSSGQ